MKNLYILLVTLFVFIYGNAQIGFQGHVVIDTTYSTYTPTSIYSVDIDNDGDNDVVFLSTEDNKIGWYENLNGLGDFSVQKIISNNVNNEGSFLPDAVNVADIDGDNDLDIISASQNDNKIAWYENLDGQGNFSTEQNITLDLVEAKSVYTSDIDGDGDMDVISISQSEDNIFWFENLDGLGNFGVQQIINTNGHRPYSINLNDIDGDGDIDIIPESINFGWYENIDGLGNFSELNIIYESFNSIKSVNSGDIDGDGDIDVFSGHTTFIHWFENLDGLGNFGEIQSINNPITNNSFVIKDLDDDGDNDILTSNTWFENLDGLGNFGPYSEIFQHTDYSKVFAGDINGDGYIDALFADFPLSTLSWNENLDGQGTFGIKQTISVNVVKPKFILSGDIDNDGDLDLVCASYSDRELSWFENLDGFGSYGEQRIISNEVFSIDTFFIADVNNDNNLDIIAESTLNNVVWFENLDGLGNFSEQIVFGMQQGITTILACDIDNDNDNDVIVGSYYDETIAWYENLDGQGNFGAQQDIINTVDVKSIYSSDLDNDGDIDILSANGDSDSVFWYENIDGNGNFVSHTINNVPDAKSVYASDIDGDGDIDVISADSNNLTWNENLDGLGNFGSQQLIEDHSSNNIYSEDLDNDGDMDILTSSSWYENLDGLGNFGSEQIIEIAYRSTAGDINNDGLIDFVTANWYNADPYWGVIKWFENLGDLNQISGNIKFDIDLNGCDPNDFPTPNLMIITDNGDETLATYTDENGDFSFYTNEGEFVTIIGGEIPNYFTINPNSHLSTFVGLGNTDVVDFCIESNQTINDVNIVIYPLIGARPGFDVSYQLVYRNVGTTVLSDDVSITYDDAKMSFLEASETITSQTSNSLTFDYYDLLPFETRTIDLLFNVFTPPTTEIDDVLTFTAIVNPISGDYTEDDNTFILDQIVIGAYDPNDIQVLEGDEIYLE